MGITAFKHTMLAQVNIKNYRCVDIKNIQIGYKKPAWRHQVEYDDAVLDYLDKNDQRIRNYRGVAYARELIIDLDLKKGESFTRLCNDTYQSIESLVAKFGFSENDITIYFSGDNGLHLHIPTKLFGLRPQKKLPERMGMLVHQLCDELHLARHIDYNIYQSNQYVRLPYTPHNDTGYYKIVIPFARLNNLPLKVIRREATNPDFSTIERPKKQVKQSAKLAALWNDIVVAPLRAKPTKVFGVESGQRHNEGLRVIRTYRAQCLSLDDTIKGVELWDKTNSPPMNESTWIRSATMNWYEKTKSWSSDKCFFFIDDHAPLMYILNHPALSIEDRGLLSHIYYHVNNVKKEWFIIRVHPGCGVFTLGALVAALGINEYSVRKSLNKLVANGLIFKGLLKHRGKDKGLYIMLGELLRAMKLGNDYDINKLGLPLSKAPNMRWEARLRYLNSKDIGNINWDEADEDASNLDAV